LEFSTIPKDYRKLPVKGVLLPLTPPLPYTFSFSAKGFLPNISEAPNLILRASALFLRFTAFYAQVFRIYSFFYFFVKYFYLNFRNIFSARNRRFSLKTMAFVTSEGYSFDVLPIYLFFIILSSVYLASRNCYIFTNFENFH